jgi:hypothetical protein
VLTLSFTVVDDLAFAAERRKSAAPEKLVADNIGPLLELRHLACHGLIPGLDDCPWLDLGELSSFCEALSNAHQLKWVCPRTRRLGFFRLTSLLPSDETPWIEFSVAAQKAAASAGFYPDTARQFVAAMGEMRSNIYEHSAYPQTGLVAFFGHSERFEFVVADRGVGVLETLRSSAEYAGLVDHGEALRLCLSDGVTRFAGSVGHGNGFRPLFRGLANLRGMLRFRSGNHALSIEGENPSVILARVAQKANIAGFFASVASGRPSGSHFRGEP